jgi:hypothetical protein
MIERQPVVPPGDTAEFLQKPGGFSLTSGGALYQLWRRTRLAGDDLQFTRRRVLVAVLLAWVPLLLLSLAEGRALGSGVALTFLQDVETQVRLLIVMPLLILAEVEVHRKLPSIVRRFVEHGLVPDAARPGFDAAIASALRLRNSVVAELLLVVFVYLVGVFIIRRTQFALDTNSWYATLEGGQLRLTPAGWWGALVSVPLVQFLMVRWYFRFFIWARFLWQVSRLDLHLEPTHPDATAGLHFVTLSERAYRPVLMALGAALAGMIANRIFFAGAALLDFKVEIIGTAALLVFVVLGPMLAFTPKLIATRREGLQHYGALGQRYAREFDRKWMRDGGSTGEPLLGSADIQSLADLRNGFLVVKDIKPVPFDTKNVVALTVTTLLPVAPLLLTTFSVEQILERVLKVLL